MSEGNFIRESGVNRVIGVPADEEKDFLEIFKTLFENDFKIDQELEKSKEVEKLIDDLNRYLKIFFQKYGVEWFEIPSRNIHVIDGTKLTSSEREALRTSGKLGQFLEKYQQIAILRHPEEDFVSFALTTAHEMIHFNCFQSWEKTRISNSTTIDLKDEEDDLDISLKPRRQGARVYSKTGAAFFSGIDEAVVSELAMRFDQEFFSKIEGVKEGVEFRNRVLARNPGIPRDLAKISESETLADGRKAFDLFTYSYHKERKKLNKIIREIFAKNPDEFSSEEEVFNLFVKTLFTGRLLPLARVYEKTFGEGSFRKLGEKTKSK